jgi:hypothetical protein
MERTLAGIRTGEDVKLAETEDFYTPKNKIEILGNTLQFIGLNGFGLLSGLNVVIEGGLMKSKSSWKKGGSNILAVMEIKAFT